MYRFDGVANIPCHLLKFMIHCTCTFVASTGLSDNCVVVGEHVSFITCSCMVLFKEHRYSHNSESSSTYNVCSVSSD